jgi:hypothetical protein
MRNRKILFVTTSLIVVLFASSYFSPASALLTYTEHMNAVGEGIKVVIPGITPESGVQLSFAHYDGGTHGVRDNIALYVYAPNYPNGPRMAMAAWFSDTDQGVAYIGELMSGTNVKIGQLKPWQIQVCRIGKIAMAYWTTPLEAPAVPAYGMPAITVPPGCIVLKGYGDVTSGTIGPNNYAWSGFTFSVAWSGHSAEGYFACPQWDYYGSITGTATLRIDATQTATHP